MYPGTNCMTSKDMIKYSAAIMSSSSPKFLLLLFLNGMQEFLLGS
jgi:hypothetical protein